GPAGGAGPSAPGGDPDGPVDAGRGLDSRLRRAPAQGGLRAKVGDEQAFRSFALAGGCASAWGSGWHSVARPIEEDDGQAVELVVARLHDGAVDDLEVGVCAQPPRHLLAQS